MIMDTKEARVAIATEFMNGFYEFLADVKAYNNGGFDPHDFGMKYGYRLTENGRKEHSKDTQKNMLWYHSHIFSGRHTNGWVKAGYTAEVIWKLWHEGFLSHDDCWSYKARIAGKTDFYYINQNTAKQIYKAHKEA